MLEIMILAAAKYELSPQRFPTTGRDFALLRSEKQRSKCEVDFYRKTKGVDE
jgi:hypothetical protein